jgi:IS4 transposase
MIVGFAVGGEARSIAAYRRTYNGATGQNLVASSFYDRFTEQLEQLLRDLLDRAVEEVAVPHTVAPAFDRFRDVIVADATVVRLIRFLSAFPATHPGVSGIKLYLVHSVTTQSVIARAITDERTHESTLFKTGSWLRGRLFLLDLGFFKYRRFALIDENDGFFISRLKRSANPLIVRELVHQIDRRDDDECRNANVGDGLDAEKRLAAAGRQNDAAPPAVIAPRVEGGLLVVPRFDLNGWRECEVRVGSRFVRDVGLLPRTLVEL